MRHERPTDETREVAALYCLEVLDRGDCEAFERHLLDGCPTCAADVDSFRRTSAALAFVAPPASPPPALRDRLLERIRQERTEPRHPGQVWKDWKPGDADATSFLIRAGQSEWQRTGFEGIQVRRLFVDPAADRVTMLIKMEPGTSYPPHRHGGAEECYVLQGDLRVGESTVMHAGDYQRMDKDAVHETQSTENGCVLFLVSSAHDEILA